MRKILLLSALILVVSVSPTRADSVDGATFSSIAFDHKGNTILAGTSFGFGFFITVSDRGRVTTRVLSGDDHWGIRDLKFVTKNVGWLSNNGGVYRTSDQGRTWNMKPGMFSGVPSRVMGPRVFSSVDELTAWTIVWWTTPSEFGAVLLQTEDGGKSWSRRNLPDVDFEIQKMEFTNTVHGFVWGYELSPCRCNRVFKTSDKGETWEEVQIGGKSVDPRDLRILNSAETVMLTDQKIFKTGNNGVEWHSIDLPTEAEGLNGFDFINDKVGWMWGKEFFLTVDGGETWKHFSPKSFPKDIDSVRFANQKLGWAIKYYSFSKGAYFTKDGGRTWRLFPAKWQRKISNETYRRRFPDMQKSSK